MGDLSWSTRRGLSALALVVGLLAACSDDDPEPGKGLFATPCDEDTDCKSLICAGPEGGAKLCTEACTDPLGDECDDGFRCRRPERKEALVCVCTNPAGCEVVEPVDCDLAGACDDGVECTDDFCSGDECRHIVHPELCDVGSSCYPSEGCVQNQECDGDSDCSVASDACRSNGFCDFRSGRCHYDVTDDDLDGHHPPACGGDDCNDFHSGTHRLAQELCDATDNDCDGPVDEDAEQFCSGACSFGQCECQFPFTECFNNGCTDTRSDNLNCGGCGVVCDNGFICLDGRCSGEVQCADGVVCPPNSTCADVPPKIECRCDSGFEPNASATECIDINECDRPFNPCDDARSVCVNLFGSFQCVCGNGFQDFGSGCVDINECAEGFDCGHGFCQNLTGGFQCSCDAGYAPHPIDQICQVVDECEAGLLQDFRWCDGACRDLRNDSSHCGSCFTSCTDGASCDDMVCTCDDTALTYCDGACVNTRARPDHCGECYNACPVDGACVNGDCFCPMGQENCDGVCTTLGSTSHCSACNDACASGATCSANGCVCPAGAPLVCDGQCINPNDDEFNCGECFHSCPEEATCGGGECVCPAATPELCENTFSCNDFETSELACGDCDTSCGVICNEGACSTAEALALGQGMGCVLFGDGRVGCFGSNDSGRLGRNLATSVVSQTIGLLPLTGIEAIAAHAAHACALDGGGVLRCWGENSSQQLGNGNTTDQVSPVMTRTGVAQVAVGLAHTCVVLEAARKVECIGSDVQGQRGDGPTSPAFGTWTGVTGLEQVDELVSGANHLCALINGEVFCWGDNTFGQLGVGTAGANTGFNAPGAKVTGLSDVTDIAAGASHTCAVASGQVLCWGNNTTFQCGSPESGNRLFATLVNGISTAASVAAGGAHSCALLQNGTMTCWGSGVDRQNFRTVTSSEPRQHLAVWSAIAAGSAHGCAIGGAPANDFYCWGDGLAITHTVDIAMPIRIQR